MNRMITLLGCAILLATSVVSQETVPSLINFQGTLTDDAGQPLDSGTYTIEFRIWNKPIAGDDGEQLIWGHAYDVAVINGRFNIILGQDSGTSIEGAAVNSIGYAFTEAERYLGVTPTHFEDVEIESASELAPRQRILSTAYALHAHTALNGLPVGTVITFAGPVDVDQPLGFIPCDGRTLNKDDYPALYDAIGTTWGAGESEGEGEGEGEVSITFKVPDLRGKATIGAGQGEIPAEGEGESEQLTLRQLAETGGEEEHKLSVAELPDHKHKYYERNTTPGWGLNWFVVSADETDYVWYWLEQTLETTETVGASGTPHNNMQPFAVMNYIIKY